MFCVYQSFNKEATYFLTYLFCSGSRTVGLRMRILRTAIWGFYNGTKVRVRVLSTSTSAF